MNKRSNGKRLLALCGIIVLLSGCATTLSRVSDRPYQESQTRPTLGTSIDDRKMEALIGANIKQAHVQLDSAHINVHSFNRAVLLTGEVPNEEMKNLAGKPRAYRGAREVYNELQVRTNTGMLARSNDSWLETKVSSRLIAEKNLNTRGIEVVVEDSVVYLMGKTTRRDANLMATIASRIGGVQRVVKVFEYLD